MEPDALDRKIMNLLLDNSRLSYREVAKNLRVSAATVIKRIRALEEAKVMRRYTMDIDYHLAGYDIKAIIELRISKGKLFEVEKKLARHPNVFSVYDITGDFDAILITRFRTRSRLDRFLKEIQTYDFVERTRTSLILNTIKERQEAIE